MLLAILKMKLNFIFKIEIWSLEHFPNEGQ